MLYWGDTKYLDSPNSDFYLTFSHFAEPKMGVTVCLFNLINRQNEIIENFEPLVALGNGNEANWSEDSNYFSTPLITVDDNYFIYDIKHKMFSVIPVKNAWVLKSFLTNTRFELEYEDSQIPDKKEAINYPTKNYLKPDNYKVDLKELTWHNVDEIKNFKQVYNSKKAIELRPIDKGFRVFKGDFPLTTDRTVWDIERFAEYGDEQSRIWMTEINTLTKGDYYRWKNASDYIGHKKREKYGR